VRKLKAWIADGAIDVVIPTGGTGVTPPGSPGACRDGSDDILKWQLDSRFRPCNLVELMPRLQEHLKSA
jgi:molybdopterin biosynthesis enzyme MoaB